MRELATQQGEIEIEIGRCHICCPFDGPHHLSHREPTPYAELRRRSPGSAPGGSRTPNLLIRSQMLYPLSYRRSAPAYRRGPAAPTPRAIGGAHRAGARSEPRPRSGHAGWDRMKNSVPCSLGFASSTASSSVGASSCATTTRTPWACASASAGAGSLIASSEMPPSPSERPFGDEPDRLPPDLLAIEDVPEGRRGRIGDLEHDAPSFRGRGLGSYPTDRMGHLLRPCLSPGSRAGVASSREHGTTGHESGLPGLPPRVDGGAGRCAARARRARHRPDRRGTEPTGRGAEEAPTPVPMVAPVPQTPVASQRGSGRSRFQCRTTEHSHTRTTSRSDKTGCCWTSRRRTPGPRPRRDPEQSHPAHREPSPHGEPAV